MQKISINALLLPLHNNNSMGFKYAPLSACVVGLVVDLAGKCAPDEVGGICWWTAGDEEDDDASDGSPGELPPAVTDHLLR